MSERKTRAIYGRRLREALQEDMRPQLNSEELDAYRPYFVDINLLEKINNNTSQLIVGRRGTGKTHLLGAFHELIRDDHPTQMSVMISINEVAPRARVYDPSQSPVTETQRVAQSLFESYLHVFFDRFLDACSQRMEVLVASGAYPVKKIERANSLLTQLLEAIELGSPIAQTRKKTEKSTDTTQSDSTSGISAAGGVDLKSVKLHAGGKIGRSEDKKSASETITSIESLLTLDTYAVRRLVVAVLDNLAIDTLFLLIDEWMELDKRRPSNVQPAFAQLLKGTFLKDRRIAVKIASIWDLTTLYDRQDTRESQGLVLKHDLSQACDLDTTLMTSDSEARNFCKELLFKRLSTICPALQGLCVRNGDIDDIFISELFDNEANFRVFIAASHGIPRDLMNLFQKCSLKINRDFESHCIGHELVCDIVRRAYMQEKTKAVDDTSPAYRLLRDINGYMEKTGRRLFVVDGEAALRSSALRKLVDEELIHQVPSSAAPRAVRDAYKCYVIDFGNYVDWIMARKRDLAELLAESLIPQFPGDFAENLPSYVIDLASIDDPTISCPKCARRISSSDPIFVKYRACPSCAESIA